MTIVHLISVVVVCVSLVLPSLPAVAAPAAPTSVGKIAAVENQVETKRASGGGYEPSTLEQPLYDKDRVRTGPGSRAAILYTDRTLHRINERSEIEVQPPSAGQPGLLKIISGTHYFSSRSPKEYGRIETPTVTAAIKGTEFVVEVDPDTTTKITMIEGVVEATNAFGGVSVGRGEQAYVEPGKAPVKRIVVHPRDAVAWALYYPPVLGARDSDRLKEAGGVGGDLTKAAQLLSSGQVEAARPLIQSSRDKEPDNAVALALASVVATASNENKEGMRLAERAVAADRRSGAAALALSYAAQAAFDIPRAREMAEKAAELDPASSVALARAAELRMAEGDLAGATRAAEDAVKRTPNDARALSVLGFIELAKERTHAAASLFSKAVAADSGLSMARLGMGITKIREGHVRQGREELQAATALDPDDSLLRSYLGKALYEERLSKDAGKELAAAKDLDPLDPTPYLYDAIRKENDNRPVEALEDLQASIERNDNRAVYRSRMLLDQDRAVRGVDLARIYTDLGFNELGLVTARRSADEDQSNYSSHLFLASHYREVPFFAPAYLSEILQARIYQPVGVNAARPDVVAESVSFNEYTALFDRPRVRGFGDFAYQRTDTDLSEVVGRNNPLASLITLDDSDGWSGTVVGTVNRDRLSGAFTYQKITDDGFRFNNDEKIVNYRGFLEWAPTYRDTIQLNALLGRQETGDLPLRLLPILFTSERFDTGLWNIGLGYHRTLDPAMDLVVSAIYNRTKQTALPFFCGGTTTGACGPVAVGTTSTGILDGPQLEAQYVWRMPWMTWVLGAGGFQGKVTLQSSAGGELDHDDDFANGYAYVTLRPTSRLDVTLGATEQHVDAPVGLLAPRDSQIPAAEVSFDDSRLSHKVGVTYRPFAHTTIRGASYSRLAPAIGRIQTLEPTQVAGFNQFFFEPGGTHSRAWGGGIDQEFGSHFFAGGQYLRRRLDVPEAVCSNPDPFSGCAGQTPTDIEQKFSRNADASAYLSAVLSPRATFGVDYSYEKRDFDETRVNNDGLFQDYNKTWRLAPNLRYFWTNGMFATARATWYNQKIDEFDDLSSPERHVRTADFWLIDVTAGYRLPNRYGSIILEAHNLSDREFEAFDRAVEDTFVPARTVTLRLDITY